MVSRMSLNRMAVYMMGVFMSFWCLGYSMPGVGVGVFMVGVLMLFYLAPALFLKKNINVGYKFLIPAFLFCHLILYSPFKGVDYTLDFVLHITSAIFLFIVMVSLVDDMITYSNLVRIVLALLVLITGFLVYRHLFVFHSFYLTANVHEVYWSGRAGKNTLSFFLAAMFPYAYARFTYKRSLVNTLSAGLIGFAILYTISRMAMGSMALAMGLFCLIGIDRKRYIKQTAVLLILALVVSAFFGVGMGTYLKHRNPAATEIEIERGEVQFMSDSEGKRDRLKALAIEGFMKNPLYGQGLGAFRADKDKGNGSQTHNDYFQILHDMGLIGILLFLLLISTALWDLWKCRRYVRERDYWLWEGQLVSLLCLCAMIQFINAYETIPFWFALAGCRIISQSVGREHKEKVEDAADANGTA